MKHLKLEDIVLKHYVQNNEYAKIHYFDSNTFNVMEKIIILDKTYEPAMDSIVLDMIINKMIISNMKSEHDMKIYDREMSLTQDNLTVLRKIISKVYAVSNMIARESRIGPGTHIICTFDMTFLIGFFFSYI